MVYIKEHNATVEKEAPPLKKKKKGKAPSKSDFHPPEQLQKLYLLRGKELVFSRDEVYEYNVTNYKPEDILIENIKFEFKDFMPPHTHYGMHIEGKCRFSKDATIPVLKWNHISLTALTDLVNQVGKIVHNISTDTNGVGLARFYGSIRSSVPIEDITFKLDPVLFVRQKKVWCRSQWSFYRKGKKFANLYTLSASVPREYDMETKNSH